MHAYIYIYIHIQTVYALADTVGTTENYRCMIVNGVYDLTPCIVSLNCPAVADVTPVSDASRAILLTGSAAKAVVEDFGTCQQIFKLS